MCDSGHLTNPKFFGPTLTLFIENEKYKYNKYNVSWFKISGKNSWVTDILKCDSLTIYCKIYKLNRDNYLRLKKGGFEPD